MDIVPVDPDDRAALGDYVAVGNAARAVDTPWAHPRTLREAEGELRYGWDLEPGVGFLARADGAVVGVAEHAVSEYDNLHLAWLRIEVHPQYRRRGHGTTILGALLERTRTTGRTSVVVTGPDSPATTGFADRHGLVRASADVIRRQVLAEVDPAVLDRLQAGAAPHATAYELVRLDGPVPEAVVAAYSEMVASINDAPVDDLDLEDEVFSVGRLRAYEETQRLRGLRLHRVYARHRGTGELAGQTAVAVDTERPHLAEQHDTSVVSGHRGHRLGLLLKVEMLRWLAEAEPQLASIDTGNAESNRHMIAVNEALGYRVVGREVAFQRRV